MTPISSLRELLAHLPWLLIVVLGPAPSLADDPLSAESIVAAAHKAAGGDTWRHLETLKLSGHATFFRDGRHAMSAHADSYRMHRVLPRESKDAHIANGMVRFDAHAGERVVFQISFDGEASYDQNGLIDDAAATERWKSNFGFGIIRFALEDGFELTRLADDTVEGHPCHFVEVIDPSQRKTIFGIDRESYAIRMVGFDTPQGFHHRIYDSFYRKPEYQFTQPEHVRLFYDGVKTADIRWTDYSINEPIERNVFVISAEATSGDPS